MRKPAARLTGLPAVYIYLKTVLPETSAASRTIRFAAVHGNVMMVLSGMRNMEQVVDNTSYMESFVLLSRQEFSAVWKAAGIINSSVSTPCTGCFCRINYMSKEYRHFQILFVPQCRYAGIGEQGMDSPAYRSSLEMPANASGERDVRRCVPGICPSADG